MNNYIPYHVHSWYSLLDSVTNFKSYVDRAVELGQKAIAITEHGNIYNWLEKKQYCESRGIKYIHGCEVYLTLQSTYYLQDGDKEKSVKVRDNFHTILLAKNHDGFLELNTLVSNSSKEMYFKPRITFDDFLNISDNILIISACLQSPLNIEHAKRVSDGLIKKYNTDLGYLKLYKEKYELMCNKYDYYEVQPHINNTEQYIYNKYLAELSKKYDKPLICGTDTHSLNDYMAECREILQLSKNFNYGEDTAEGEQSCDLTYKTYQELVNLFRQQGALTEEQYLSAIDNTNDLYYIINDYSIDTSTKYPIMYGSTKKDEEMFIARVYKMFDEKLQNGIIPYSQKEQFLTRLEEELRVFKKTNMCGFMLSMSEIIGWCRNNGIPTGFSRGSCGGSCAAYVTDIIDLNPVQWNTVFSRFCNEDRIEIGDIDTDVFEEDRPKIYSNIIERFGVEKTGYVLAFGTAASLAAIDDIGRALARKWRNKHIDKNKKYSKAELDNIDSNNPYSLQKMKQIKSLYKSDEQLTRDKYKELFYYYDGICGVPTSQSMHPAGIVASPITLYDNIGTFIDSNGNVILQLDMDNCHDIGCAKYDILGLKNVGIIKKTTQYIGEPFPKSNEINWNDRNVWMDMMRSPVGIFQFEEQYAFSLLKEFKTASIEDMCLVTASVRPSGASYREQLIKRIPHKNPSEMIDKMLEKNLGYLIYQCDTIKFLQDICGLSGSEADNVRRAIGHKDIERLQKALPDILNGYCDKSDKPREIAEREAKEFLQVIEDSASYQFGYNHSVGYSMLGYLCAYYRYYHPIEFLAAFLNCSKTEEDIANGTELAKIYNVKIIRPKFRHSKSEYWIDNSTNSIYKGIRSIKYLNDEVATQLYELRDNMYNNFTELLYDIITKTSVDNRQLDILIRIDFFSEFGNSKELLRIVDMFNLFKQGDAKSIKKEKIANDSTLTNIVSRHSIGITKAGKPAANFSALDCPAILAECEAFLRSLNISDFSLKEKMATHKEYMGYVDLTTGKQADRCKLIVLDVFPLKKDGRTWGHKVSVQSLGSGIKNSFTIMSRNYKDPIQENDLIYCKQWHRKNQWLYIDDYYVMVGV